MPITINVNKLSLCHKGSNGISTATIPDVCMTPSAPSPVPIPYPNIAMSSDLVKGTKTIKADGGMMCANYGSEFMKSTGDEPGCLGGVASGTFIKEASWITFSFDVKLEGKAACRLTDKMFHNHMNTVNMAGELQAPLVAPAGTPEGRCIQCRRELVEEGKKSSDPNTRAAADRLEKQIPDYESAKLSASTYHKVGCPEYNRLTKGWKNVGDDSAALSKYGLKPTDLEDPANSQFRARLYEPDPAVLGDGFKPNIAMKGTTFLSGQDWKNNIHQAISANAPYYKKAVNIGNKVAQSNQSVVFTGHSLGGGLASAASGASGQSGVTFNAAGLANDTIKKYGGIAKNSDITAYRVDGEILTDLQETSIGDAAGAVAKGGLFGGAIGGLIGNIPGAVAGALKGVMVSLSKEVLALALPDAVGTPQVLPASSTDPVSRHFMDDVLEGMEKQMGEDQKTLEDATGMKCSCEASKKIKCDCC